MSDPHSSVEIAEVSRRFGAVLAVDRVSLRVGRGELFCLLGPSGCGKTTLLRLLGGFERPDAGRLFVEGTDVTALPPHRRPVNMVFQHYALFPHLTVTENVAFGFRYAGYPRGEHPRRVAEALALVRLDGCEKRLPHQLSGGQRQRVALARALALRPRVLLLDEPLGALDRKLRREMQDELRSLQRRLGIGFMLVTHDQEEALTLADRLAVMNAGRLEQVGTPAEVFERPRTAFVAEFMGAGNLFTAEVVATAGPRLGLALPGQSPFEVAALPAAPPAGARVRFVVRPERLALRRAGAPAPGWPSLPVIVVERTYQGAAVTWTLRSAAGDRYTAWAPSGASPGGAVEPAVGEAAALSWDPRHVVLLEAGAGDG
jgi:spermidine/putrescine ABC transporter ATP-binding subunit